MSYFQESGTVKAESEAHLSKKAFNVKCIYGKDNREAGRAGFKGLEIKQC